MSAAVDEEWITAIHIDHLGDNLVLLIDMQAGNKGASLTNTVEKAIHLVAEKLPAAVGATWIEVDSEGYFDELVTNITRGMPLDQVTVDFKPLRQGAHQRSLDGFLEKFQQAGAQAWGLASQFIPSPKKGLKP
ncbi:hypothetical protein ACKF11_13105 [Methylobacillus sp. Pita2]|uniref:hypothetical protein n=1 Tax=Methylobacillus sp. Pita2 TaxID=3383245 RepID=UPI0038B5BBDD